MLLSIFGENMFDDFFDGGFFGAHNPLYGKHARNLMKTDIHEKDGVYEIAVDLPGFKKDEINLDVKDGYLTISAEMGTPDKKGVCQIVDNHHDHGNHGRDGIPEYSLSNRGVLKQFCLVFTCIFRFHYIYLSFTLT